MTATREHLAAFEALIEEHITLLGCTNDTARAAQIALCAQSAPEPVQGEAVEVVAWKIRGYITDKRDSAISFINHHDLPGHELRALVDRDDYWRAIGAARRTAAAKPDAELVELLRDARQQLYQTCISREDEQELKAMIDRIDARLIQCRSS